VRQGCKLSPVLFNIYIEQAINKCKGCPGIKVTGVRLHMLMFADDVAIIVQNEINLKKTITKLR